MPVLRRTPWHMEADGRDLLPRVLPQEGGEGAARNAKKHRGTVMDGIEIRTARKAAGLSQATLAKLAGIGRHAVIYWESRKGFSPRGWAVARMLDVLSTPAEAATGPICGAMTRGGTPCQCAPEAGAMRCRTHGGASTGPRTIEGREKVADAQRVAQSARWALFRVQRTAFGHDVEPTRGKAAWAALRALAGVADSA